MDVARSAIEAIYTDVVNSLGYKTTVGPTDKKKVSDRLAGKPTAQPRARLARAGWRAAGLLTPLTPTPAPTPPTTYLKVAPITVREEGGSDQRVCLFESDGSLRPGVRRLPNGQYTDDSAALYAADGDGLENSSIRSKVADPALVGARSMDGRSACQCPPTGDPTKNSGSWTV